MSNLDDNFWYDKVFTVAFAVIMGIFGWIGFTYRNVRKDIDDLKTKVSDLEKENEVRKRVSEEIAKATEKALYSKNL